MSKGNCVDKFISKRIDEKINGLLKHKLNIRRRVDKRENTEDYFNTLCYEQDFSDIIELRNIANDLVINCNKFLERISEQYSKLN
jgi:hypothetical protein